MQLEDTILREIGALTRTIHAIIEIQFKALNLQKGQSIYLTRICENPGISMKELCQLLMVDKTTTSRVVQKLIAEQLVLKKQNSQDQRTFHLFPTAKSGQAYQAIIAEENRLTTQCYAGMGRNQRKMLLELVCKMRQNIDEDWYMLKNYR